jgi:Bacterial regulatory protein, Fis family
LMLARHGGNKRHTARTLGISYHTLKAYLRTPFSEPPAAATDVAVREGEAIGATSAV